MLFLCPLDFAVTAMQYTDHATLVAMFSLLVQSFPSRARRSAMAGGADGLCGHERVPSRVAGSLSGPSGQRIRLVAGLLAASILVSTSGCQSEAAERANGQPIAALTSLSVASRNAAPSTRWPTAPEPLDLGASESAHTDALYPVGWSNDERKLAFVYRYSGGGAAASRLFLVVQDLVSDVKVAELSISQSEGDDDPSMVQEWSSRRLEIERMLRTHGIRPVSFRLESFPAFEGRHMTTASATAYSATTIQTLRDGPECVRYVCVGRFRIALRASTGREEKVLEDRTYSNDDFSAPLAVGVVGYLRSPRGDRLAVIVKEANISGFEFEHGQSFRFVGAGIGPLF